MPRKSRNLTAAEINRLAPRYADKPTAYAVGGVDGLHIQISPSGARSWFLRYSIGDKRRRRFGLGPYPEVKLGAARDRAREAREMIRQGLDPIEQGRAARAALVASASRLTFADAVDKYLAFKLEEFRNEKHRKQWRSTLDNYAAPVIGDVPVADLTIANIVSVLEPIWATKNETASRLRGRMENVLSWATVQGHREGDNPARWRGNLSEILPKPSKVAKAGNQPALALPDAAQWFADLRGRKGAATRALEFVMLTCARSGEVRGMTWDEVDLKAKVWTVPAERMKMGKEHTVPLTADAMKLLEGLKRREDSPFVFPAVRGGALSDAALSACMKRIHEAKSKSDGKGYLDRQSGRPAVPHGLRSTFRDWAAETGQDHILAELALAHSVGDATARAYRRSDMVERRRVMLEKWASHLNAGR